MRERESLGQCLIFFSLKQESSNIDIMMEFSEPPGRPLTCVVFATFPGKKKKSCCCRLIHPFHCVLLLPVMTKSVSFLPFRKSANR